MFATSETFKNIYIIELAIWTNGMPPAMYNDMLKMYKLPPVPTESVRANVDKVVNRDIPVLGTLGITILEEIGITISAALEGCVLCKKCMEECPEDAITIEQKGEDKIAIIRTDKCGGTACRRCENVCPKETLHLRDMKIM